MVFVKWADSTGVFALCDWEAEWNSDILFNGFLPGHGVRVLLEHRLFDEIGVFIHGKMWWKRGRGWSVVKGLCHGRYGRKDCEPRMNAN